jgi:radical SAM protein with 4Fe4S-binding SPASM domain
MRQRAKEEGRAINADTFGMDAMTKGCLGGQGFAFISHVGIVQICGYLDIKCGDIRKETFRDIWHNSPVFKAMRDVDNYHGRCGYCEYRRVCGGCRARAYEFSGDYLDEEPLCSFQPRGKPRVQSVKCKAEE